MYRNFPGQLLALLLVIVLTAPTPLLAQGQPGSPENASNKPGEGGEGTEAPDPDADGDGESDAKEADASAAAAAEIEAAIEVAGVDATVDRVDTSERPTAVGGRVSVDGQEMSVAQAYEYVGSLASARDAGLNTSPPPGGAGVDREATAAGILNGTLESGEVVGQRSGAEGSPSDVARAEIEVTGREAALNSVTTMDEFYGSALATPGVKDLSQALTTAAYGQLANSARQAGLITLGGTVQYNPQTGNVSAQYTVNQELAGAYKEYAEVMGASGNLSLSGTTNTAFTYEPTTGVFVGRQNGLAVDPANVPYSARVMEIAKQDSQTIVSIDLSKGSGVITTQNTMTGRINNYNAETGVVLNTETTTNLFSSSPLGPLQGDSLWGTGTLGQFNNLSPMQRAMFGEPVSGDDLEKMAETFADVLVGENAGIAGKIGRGEPLTTEEMAEAIAIVGVTINRSASTGQNALSYVNNTIFSSYNASNRDRLSELSQNPSYNHDRVASFYAGIFNGQTTTKTFSNDTLEDVTPAAFATHFYSGPASNISWAPSVTPGSSRQVGEHTFTNVNLRGSNTQEFSLARVSGLPDYIQELDVNRTSLMEVVNLSSGLYSDTITAPDDLTAPAEPTGLFGTNERNIFAAYEQHRQNEIAKAPTKEVDTSCHCIKEAITGKDRPLGTNQSYKDQLDQAARMVNEKHPELGINITIYSGTQRNPNYDPAKDGPGSGRHAKGNGGDVVITDKNGNVITDINVLADFAHAISTINPQSGIGYSNGSKTITHIDFEPDPNNNYHGTWGYGGGKNQELQSAWEAGAKNSDREVTPPSNDFSSGSRPSNPGSSSGTGRAIGEMFGGLIAGDTGAALGGLLGGLLDRYGTFDGPSSGSVNSFPSFGPGGYDADICPDGQADCPDPSNGGGMLWLSVINNPQLTSWARNIFDSSGVNMNTTPEISNSVVIPVTITIDNSANTIEVSREDILNELEEERTYYSSSISELASVVAIMDEAPFSFDASGNIIYSNGLYSPAMHNGQLVETGTDYEYVYTIRYKDDGGDWISAPENKDVLPNGRLSELLKQALTNTTGFGEAQLKTVQYRLVDPNMNIPADEYYDYVVTLKDGSTRAVTIPQFTSVSFMKERFETIGYYGDVLTLLGMATEDTSKRPESWMKRIATVLKGFVGNFTDTLKTDDGSYADLPLPSSRLRSNDVKALFIYPTADVPCPADADGYGTGFMYTALITDPANTDQMFQVTDGRCGLGDPTELAAETAHHLKDVYGIEDASYETLSNRILFQNEPVLFTPGIVKVGTLGNETVTVTDSETESGEEPSTPEPTESEARPNLTNTITFEVKVTSGSGVVSNWSSAESVTIGTGDQLHFRWNGTDYGQCLPFLNDNGNYALTVRNQAMVTGDTESEGYNVNERSGAYRVECGGQRNNEYGVDSREIGVTVR